MNKVSKLALALGMALALPSAAFAGTATSHVAVSATVSNTCNINAATLAFGTYDGLNANATTALTGQAVFTYQCNNKTVPTIGLGQGLNHASAIGTTRAMSDGTGGDFLSYELYTDSGFSSVWGNSSPSWLAPSTVIGNSLKSATIYGSIPFAQDAPTGTYTDTVISTINF